MTLSEEEVKRYTRQIVLRELGLKGQETLKKGRVGIIGIGGLGCVSSLQLAAVGVGFIRIVDQDVVETSNLHRQYLYDSSSLGYPKVEIAQKKLQALNPNVEVEACPLSVNRDIAEEAVKGVDVVVDGLDRIATRRVINEACVEHNVPYVFGGALMNYGNVSTVIPRETACLSCLLGQGSDAAELTCETAGVFPSILSVIASIQVSESVKLLLGRQPALANRIFFADMDSLHFETFEIAKNPNCRVCGESVKDKPVTSSEAKIAELCGKDSYMISPKIPLNLNLDEVVDRLNHLYKFRIKAAFGLTFDYSEKVSISLMQTGNMLIKGASSREEALKIYTTIMKKVEST